MGVNRVLPMHSSSLYDAKVRNAKVARRAYFRDAALKLAPLAYFKARREIGSRGEFCGVPRGASLN
jgi:hypothetical protein